jgi:1-deoxy-D-xylulose-5-phosphate synthase
VTGPDGPSHHGMWDGSLLQLVPGLRVAAPRDSARVAELLNEAVEYAEGPTVLRYPKGKVGGEVEAIGKLGRMDLLAFPGKGLGKDVLLVGVGPMALLCLEAAALLAGDGIGATVVDPRWIKPLDEALVAAAGAHREVVTVEDNGLAGGFGDAVCRLLRAGDVSTPVRVFGLPQQFLAHGSREEILSDAGLTATDLAEAITRPIRGPAPATERTSNRSLTARR